MSGKQEHTPGRQYANEAYKACLHGCADKNQQQSAAAQIALLHSAKGGLKRALTDIADAADKCARDARGEANTGEARAYTALANMARAALTLASQGEK